MTIEAYAKINWALNVLGTRPDGYHALDSLLQRVYLHDTLELTPSPDLSLTVEGSGDAPGDASNLAMRAAMALRDTAGVSEGVHIRLVKRIPSQAGLGGGSADAAAALLGLNAFWGLGLSLPELLPFAAALGSDVPACMHPGLTRIGGRGERVTPLAKPGPAFHIVLLKPQGGLSTADVFRRYDQLPDAREANMDALADALLRGDLDTAAKHSRNQMQQTAVSMLPDIGAALRDLEDAGAAFARMTGSGSAVFGVFRSDAEALRAGDALAERWPFCACTRTL